MTCSIPLSVVTASPYNLPWGTNVWATVQARNVIGSSETSNEGNGSIIVVVPDPPLNLQNIPRWTNAY